MSVNVAFPEDDHDVQVILFFLLYIQYPTEIFKMNPNFPNDFDSDSLKSDLSNSSSKNDDKSDSSVLDDDSFNIQELNVDTATENSAMSSESWENFISQMEFQDQPNSDYIVLPNILEFNNTSNLFSPFLNESDSSLSSFGECNFYLNGTESLDDENIDDTLTVLEGKMNTVMDSCQIFSTKATHLPQKNEVRINTRSERKPHPLPKMLDFRYFNYLSVQHFFVDGHQPLGEYNYEPSKAIRSPYYSPRVYRYKKTDEILKQSTPKGIVAREGLCPFCVSHDTDLLFHDINSSRYSSHLLTYHGVFTTGTGILDPLNHSYGWEIKKHGKCCEVECVTCPYPNCGVVVKVGKYKEGTASQQRFSTYIRHVADCHKDHKNSIKKRRSSY